VSRLSLAAAALVLLGVATIRVVRVTNNAMAPSVRSGDWLLLGPGAPTPGDVYLLNDPTEPERRVLRRVVALPGHSVRVTEGQLEVNGNRARIREMGRDKEHLVLSENNAWLIQRRLVTNRVTPTPTEVPDNTVWLLADARDEATDSRWWGPVPQSNLSRKVWLRFGSRSEWRGRLAARAQDGPWSVPPPQ